jgi:hypothetical protein
LRDWQDKFVGRFEESTATKAIAVANISIAQALRLGKQTETKTEAH